jgi:hypothetical protein
VYYLRNRREILERERERERRLSLRKECIKMLGGRCILCGEAEPAFLTFGHEKEGDGAMHRLALTGYSKSAGGSYFYSRLLRGNLGSRYPVQLECFNCNEAKRRISWLRSEVILAYGGKCACCGETRTSRLTIGHPHNDGGAHRKLTETGKTFYRYLKKTAFPPFPDGYELEVQCWNCNMGSSLNHGVCPHEENAGRY